MMQATAWREEFPRDGWSLVPAVLGADEVERWAAVCEPLFRASDRRRGGVRDPLGSNEPLRRAVCESPAGDLIRAIGGERACVVRSILFDKTAHSNWMVPWHQDQTIAVRERLDAPGFGPWSVKDGVAHVRPPVSVLEGMFTVRVHLDDCPRQNGALLVVPGSQRRGFLGDSEVSRCAANGPVVACEARAGDAVLMRPLLVHGSEKSERVSRRRILHLECACAPLPEPLRWASEVLVDRVEVGA